jgi:hypothetical protein
MLRKVIQVGAIIALATGTAAAQSFSPFATQDKRPPTQQEVEKQKAIDNAYKAGAAKIPDKKIDDPWGTVRPNPSPAPASKNQHQ